MSCIGLDNRPRLERRHSWQDALCKPSALITDYVLPITDYLLPITTPLAAHPCTGVEHRHAKVGTEANAQAGPELLFGPAPVRRPRPHPRNRRPLRFPGPARPLRPTAQVRPRPPRQRNHAATLNTYGRPRKNHSRDSALGGSIPRAGIPTS